MTGATSHRPTRPNVRVRVASVINGYDLVEHGRAYKVAPLSARCEARLQSVPIYHSAGARGGDPGRVRSEPRRFSVSLERDEKGKRPQERKPPQGELGRHSNRARSLHHQGEP